MKKISYLIFIMVSFFVLCLTPKATTTYFNGKTPFLQYYNGSSWVNWNDYDTSFWGYNGWTYQLRPTTGNLYSIEHLPTYFTVKLCRAYGRISLFDHNNMISSMAVENTNSYCDFSGSSIKGKVSYIIITFDGPKVLQYNCSSQGENCTFNNMNFGFQTDYEGTNYIRLMSIILSDTAPTIDDSTGGLIVQNETIINQNQEIINGQKGIYDSINAGTQSMLDSIAKNQEKLDDMTNMDVDDKYKELPDDKAHKDYQEGEKQLLDKVKEADLSDLSIGIDTSSSSFVWDTLTDLLKSHQLIFSMFIAILSIGIIKLALGR